MLLEFICFARFSVFVTWHCWRNFCKDKKYKVLKNKFLFNLICYSNQQSSDKQLYESHRSVKKKAEKEQVVAKTSS